MKKVNFKLMSVFLMICLCTGFISCGGDDDDSIDNASSSGVINGIDPKLFIGHWSFNGNIAPSFTLYSDGTCDVELVSGYDTKGTWAFNSQTNVLALSTGFTGTVKVLTAEVLSIEWTSVKYGTMVSTWNKR